jgi:hypothetical protein
MIFVIVILKNDEFGRIRSKRKRTTATNLPGEKKLHGRVSLCGGCPLQADPFAEKAY